jgi:RND family efflux transporter MFP subunit
MDLKSKLKQIHKMKHFQVLVVIVVLAVGLVASKGLIMSRKKPKKTRPPVLAPLVNAISVKLESTQITVSGSGTVKPKTEVKIVPQVAGVVVKCHRNFVNGGFFKANEPLVTIDQRDYQFAVESAEATVARAQVKLEQEQAEAKVAQSEWEQLHPGTKPDSPLVLRVPQIAQAQAELHAEQASLDKAKLNLKRTVLSVPFNGRIDEESIDIGQYVTTGQSIATVYSTEVVEIVVPLENRDLAWFDVPDRPNHIDPNNYEANLPIVDVKADFAGAVWSWQGRVVRTHGRIDPRTREVKVVVEVQNPFETSGGQPPLTPGMYVNINIKGKKLASVIRLPRHTVHNGNQVWIAKDDTLNIREVTIDRTDSEYAYITSGIASGELIVTSPIDAVTEGMAIRTEITNSNEKQE